MRVSVTTWLAAAAKLGQFSELKTRVYSSAAVHAGVRELEFTSVQFMCYERTLILEAIFAVNRNGKVIRRCCLDVTCRTGQWLAHPPPAV